MNKRLVTVFLFAIAVAAGASAILYRLVSAKLTTRPAQVQTNVVSATHVLQVGALIKEEDLKLIEWHASLPPGAIQSIDSAVGRGVASPIYEMEPLTENRLAPKGAGAGMAATIAPGMRAVAVRVNDLVGVSGFVLPGARVDVIISGTLPGSTNVNSGILSKTILQDIQVLSAGPNFQGDKEGKPISVPVVNLLVTPEQAETLSLASNEMRIQLVLRNPLDKTVISTPGVAVANLFSGVRGLPVAKTPAARPKAEASSLPSLPEAAVLRQDPVLIEVINGARRTEIKFPVAENK